MRRRKLFPFQKDAVSKLLAPGSKKALIAQIGIGSRVVLAEAAKEFKQKLIIAPISLRSEWMRETGLDKEIMSVDLGFERFYGHRTDLMIVEMSSLTDNKFELLQLLSTRTNHLWVRIYNMDISARMKLELLGFQFVEMYFDGS